MMVLSRKANDQNRTILVIYSNHRPTSFGIITLFYSVSADRYLSSSSMLEYGISIRGMPTA